VFLKRLLNRWGCFIIIDAKELILLDRLNKKKLGSEYHDFLMFEIQKHMVEINDLKAKKDKHIVNETADLSILAKMLALHEGVNKGVYTRRLKKFKAKIKS